MPAYPGTEQEQRVDSGALASFTAGVFTACGMEPADAAVLADTLVAADLRGVHSHGVMRVPEYAAKLTRGGVDPKGRPHIVRDEGAAILVDGGNSMGQIGGVYAMGLAIARARNYGLAASSVRGSNHCGAMAYYAMLALKEDMIGLAATNALPTMAPWGGLDKIVGINPLAVAMPAAEEPAVVLDTSFAASSHGKIRIYQQKGLPIPPDWACDREGQPTTDAAAAMDGFLRPIGEFKGVGLAIVMGILSAVLSGASYGTELGNMIEGAKAGQDGHFFLALKIAAFEEPGRFKQRVDRIVREVRESRRAPGAERIQAPGELEAETEALYRQEGIPLNRETLGALRAVAEQLSVEAGELVGVRARG